ncbi:LysR family transcriptional regulator [Chelonobacter oris]|uniref:LysR family transcriptional regulator n=1 Tax=Chelonobacter oris TaxID=505317 RepID=A0A0A3B8W3_9PAST|nr:LysR family transcriptional regulator [Chelonobacter oris]KGQ70019.1 LysR family transcriptional regulator [Chelonobacter oris]
MRHFNELHAFITVARAGSFTAAAQRLGVSKSALSQTIGHLEGRLNLRLFNRTTRSISLTPAGAQLFGETEPHFAAIQDGIDNLGNFKDTLSGSIRINTSELAANLILYPKLKPLLAQYPELHIDLVVDNRWVDIVGQGFDMGVRLGYAVHQDMIAVQISAAAKMVVVASPDYLHGKPAVADISDLLQHRLIGMRFSSDHQQTAWEFSVNNQTVAFQPQAPFSANNNLRYQAVRDGLGIAWLPEMAVKNDLDSGSLIELLGEYAIVYEPLYLYYPNRKGHLNIFKIVVDALRWRD